MKEAVRSEVIDVLPKELFSVIVDYEKYPEFIPEMKEVKILEKKKNETTVLFKLKIIKDIDYTLKLVEKINESVKWTLVDSNIMKANNGGWLLEKVGKNKTNATYSLGLDFKIYIPSMILNKLAGAQLPKTLQAFKNRAEGIY